MASTDESMSFSRNSLVWRSSSAMRLGAVTSRKLRMLFASPSCSAAALKDSVDVRPALVWTLTSTG